MYSILLEVSSKHIQHIAVLMVMPITQKQAEPIFFNVLTSVQHTSIIFDILKPKIPILLSSLQKDPSLQQRLVDTVKALIDHFNTISGRQDYADLVRQFEWSVVCTNLFFIHLVSFLGGRYIQSLLGVQQLQTTIGNTTLA